MKVCDIDKIDSHVNFLEALAALNVLNFGHIVQGEIKILKFFQFVEIFHFLDDIVLKVQNF